MTDAAPAPFLPDRCVFTLLHCGQPMVWAGTSTAWSGSPGAAPETTESRYTCAAACGTTTTVTVTEPA